MWYDFILLWWTEKKEGYKLDFDCVIEKIKTIAWEKKHAKTLK